MSKHKLNTYQYPTNKYLELDKEEQDVVSKIARNEIKRVFEDTDRMSPNEIRQHFKQELFKSITHLQAVIKFTEKERDIWKETVIKKPSK